jgi:hypothetical protein
MYQNLATVSLKSGESMEVGIIQAPDEQYTGKIESFLEHKGGLWNWHIEECMQKPLDDLETRFYIGQLEGNIVSNIMTVEYQGVGILGHVFTSPEHRRKGACKGVMQHQMEDFRRRGGRALYLSTGYDGHAYYIYASFGFQSVIPHSGFMRYWSEPDFEGNYFRKSEVHVKPAEWHDWGRLTALTGIVGYDFLRSMDFGIYGESSFEGGFLGFKHRLENSDHYLAAHLLETDMEAIVGFLTLVRDRRWRPESYLLDIFVHPDYWGEAKLLLDAVDWQSGKIQCYADAISLAKIECLLQYGFEREAILQRQISQGTTSMDVHVLGYWS